jgi:tetratricopeptide (TPR) repeat protein
VCLATLPSPTATGRTSSAEEVAEALAACQNEDKMAELRARACTLLIATPDIDADIRAEALLNRGIIKQEADDLDGAIADLSEAITLNPEYPAIYAQRAGVYEEKGLLELALADLSALIGLVPDDADTYASRGDLHARLGDSKKAAEDYRAALKLEPGNEVANAGLRSLGAK